MPYLLHKTWCPDPVASAAAIPDEANCSWFISLTTVNGEWVQQWVAKPQNIMEMPWLEMKLTGPVVTASARFGYLTAMHRKAWQTNDHVVAHQWAKTIPQNLRWANLSSTCGVTMSTKICFSGVNFQKGPMSQWLCITDLQTKMVP